MEFIFLVLTLEKSKNNLMSSLGLIEISFKNMELSHTYLAVIRAKPEPDQENIYVD